MELVVRCSSVILHTKCLIHSEMQREVDKRHHLNFELISDLLSAEVL